VEAVTGRRAATVLVAEDHPELLDLVVATIRKLGFEVVSARDGASAFELACTVRPAVAVLDVGMPGLDGLELTRRLKARPETAHTKILLLTAYADERDRLAGLAAGADEYLTKPFRLEDLTARLRVLAGDA
jgi:DNA-binding response OmpR family regulator